MTYYRVIQDFLTRGVYTPTQNVWGFLYLQWKKQGVFIPLKFGIEGKNARVLFFFLLILNSDFGSELQALGIDGKIAGCFRSVKSTSSFEAQLLKD